MRLYPHICYQARYCHVPLILSYLILFHFILRWLRIASAPLRYYHLISFPLAFPVRNIHTLSTSICHCSCLHIINPPCPRSQGGSRQLPSISPVVVVRTALRAREGISRNDFRPQGKGASHLVLSQPRSEQNRREQNRTQTTASSTSDVSDMT